MQGDATLEASFGGIRFSDVRRKVTCTGSNSRVTGVRTGGTVVVRNTFGAVDISEAAGVDIENSNGKMLTSSFGAIEASDVRGNVTAVNSNAAVTLTDIGSSADVRTQFGKVSLTRIRGWAKVSSENAGVALS